MLKKKLFVLASVSALTGLMATAGAACSSSTDLVGPVASDTGTGKDSAAPPVEASIPDPEASTDAGTCPDPTPITSSALEMALAPAVWAAPAATQNVCTQTNIDDLKALFAASPAGVKFTDIQTKLGTACAACTFSMTTDTKWTQFVQDGTKGYIDNTFGACMAQVEGAACGKASFQLDQCVRTVCPQDTCTDTKTCATKAGQTACKSIGAAANAACPNFQSDVTKVCVNLFSTIAVNCGGGLDGGLDASN